MGSWHSMYPNSFKPNNCRLGKKIAADLGVGVDDNFVKPVFGELGGEGVELERSTDGN